MSEKKGWGSTVAGWFIEREEPIGSSSNTDSLDESSVDSEPTSSVINENYVTPSPTQGVFRTAPPAPTGGQVDFGAVFTAAGVDT